MERSLYLTLQLMELEVPMVLALNMIDELRDNGDTLDLLCLKEELTLPVLPISASKNEGIHDLIHAALKAAEDNAVPERIDFCCGHAHTAIHSIAHLISEDAGREILPLRFCASRIVEGDAEIMDELKLDDPTRTIIDHIVTDMEQHLGTDREAAMADMRYDFIERLCKGAVLRSGIGKERSRTLKIDGLLSHRIFAIPIFFCIMFLIFWLTFSVIGERLSRMFSIGIDAFTGKVDLLLDEANISDALHSLIINSVFAAMVSVLSFLPII